MAQDELAIQTQKPIPPFGDDLDALLTGTAPAKSVLPNPNKDIQPALRFGAPRPGHIHAGTDFGGTLNDPVGAADDGEVIFAGPDGNKMGNAVKVRHADGTVSVYGHLNSVGVKVGDQVSRADSIGLLGQTGNAKGPHVHFEIRPSGTNAVDPMSTSYRPLIGQHANDPLNTLLRTGRAPTPTAVDTLNNLLTGNGQQPSVPPPPAAPALTPRQQAQITLGQSPDTETPAGASMLTPTNTANITRPRSAYETSLTPAEETQFQQWKAQYAPKDSGADYDLRGAFKAGLKPDPSTGHWPDTFKKPNHPTFSDQSQYARGPNAAKAGTWVNGTFVPPQPVSDFSEAINVAKVHGAVDQNRKVVASVMGPGSAEQYDKATPDQQYQMAQNAVHSQQISVLEAARQRQAAQRRAQVRATIQGQQSNVSNVNPGDAANNPSFDVGNKRYYFNTPEEMTAALAKRGLKMVPQPGPTLAAAAALKQPETGLGGNPLIPVDRAAAAAEGQRLDAMRAKVRAEREATAASAPPVRSKWGQELATINQEQLSPESINAEATRRIESERSSWASLSPAQQQYFTNFQSLSPAERTQQSRAIMDKAFRDAAPPVLGPLLAKAMPDSVRTWAEEGMAKMGSAWFNAAAGLMRDGIPAVAVARMFGVPEAPGTPGHAATAAANFLESGARITNNITEQIDATAGRGKGSQFALDTLGGVGGSSPTLALMALGLPPAYAFGLHGYVQARGQDAGFDETVKATTMNASIGALFQLPMAEKLAALKGIGGHLARMGYRAGTVGPGTFGIETAFGVPKEQAAKDASVNAILAGSHEAIGALKESGKGLAREVVRSNVSPNAVRDTLARFTDFKRATFVEDPSVPPIGTKFQPEQEVFGTPEPEGIPLRRTKEQLRKRAEQLLTVSDTQAAQELMDQSAQRIGDRATRAFTVYGDPETEGAGGDHVNLDTAKRYASRGRDTHPVFNVNPVDFEAVVRAVRPDLAGQMPRTPSQIPEETTLGRPLNAAPTSFEEATAPERAQAAREAQEKPQPAESQPQVDVGYPIPVGPRAEQGFGLRVGETTEFYPDRQSAEARVLQLRQGETAPRETLQTITPILESLNRAQAAGDEPAVEHFTGLARQAGARPEEINAALGQVTPPEPSTPRVAELPQTVGTQLEAMMEGRGSRKAVILPKGTAGEIPSKLPGNIATLEGPNGETVIFRKDMVAPATVRQMLEEGRSNELTGLPNAESPDATVAAVARAGVDGPSAKKGDELQAGYILPGTEGKFRKEMEAQHAPYKPVFEFGDRETEQQVLKDRQAGAPEKAPAITIPKPGATAPSTKEGRPATVKGVAPEGSKITEPVAPVAPAIPETERRAADRKSDIQYLEDMAQSFGGDVTDGPGTKVTIKINDKIQAVYPDLRSAIDEALRRKAEAIEESEKASSTKQSTETKGAQPKNAKEAAVTPVDMGLPSEVEQPSTVTKKTTSLASGAGQPAPPLKSWADARMGDFVEHEGRYVEVAGKGLRESKAKQVAAKVGGTVIPEPGRKTATQRFAVVKETPVAGKTGKRGVAEITDEPGTVHKLSNTQVNLPSDIAKKMVAAGESLIPDSEIYTDLDDPSFGREKHSHVTAKYGLWTPNPDDVRPILENEPPITLTLGKLSIFPAKEGSPYDVLKLDIESPDLHRLNKKITENAKTTQTQPDYVPHATVAYLIPGEGEKYVGKSLEGVTGKTITIDSVFFSGKNGDGAEIPLGGKEHARRIEKAVGVAGGEPSRPAPQVAARGASEVREPAEEEKPVAAPAEVGAARVQEEIAAIHDAIDHYEGDGKYEDLTDIFTFSDFVNQIESIVEDSDSPSVQGLADAVAHYRDAQQISEDFGHRMDAEGEEEEPFMAAVRRVLQSHIQPEETPRREGPEAPSPIEKKEMRMSPAQIFPAPTERMNLHTADPPPLPPDYKARPEAQTDPQITEAEAQTRIQGWKDFAARIGKEEDHSGEVVISLFDRTGEWSKPYRDAGYTVIQYDIAKGDDDNLLEHFPMGDIDDIYKGGGKVIGVLAAPPCTSYSVSGARWWKDQHDQPSPEMLEKKYGWWAPKYFDTPLEYANALVAATQLVVEMANPSDFHVLENPVGRIASQTGLPASTLTFDPYHYGDPYTKQTNLWGKFNPNLPIANVHPSEGMKIHKLRGDVPEQKLMRSETPEGFAYAFFIANNTSKLKFGEQSSTALATTEKLFIQIGARRFPFTTPEEASARWDRARDTAEVGSSEAPNPLIVKEDGTEVGHISYNGKVWENGGTGDWQDDRLVYGGPEPGEEPRFSDETFNGETARESSARAERKEIKNVRREPTRGSAERDNAQEKEGAESVPTRDLGSRERDETAPTEVAGPPQEGEKDLSSAFDELFPAGKTAEQPADKPTKLAAGGAARPTTTPLPSDNAGKKAWLTDWNARFKEVVTPANPDVDTLRALHDEAVEFRKSANVFTNADLNAKIDGLAEVLIGEKVSEEPVQAQATAPQPVKPKSKIGGATVRKAKPVEEKPDEPKSATKPKAEKTNRAGFTKGQAAFVAQETEDYAHRLMVMAFGEEGTTERRKAWEDEIPSATVDAALAVDKKEVTAKTIDVPDDGQFTVTNATQANRLHQRATGEPVEGFAKEKGTRVSTGTPHGGKYEGRIPDLNDLIAAFGGNEERTMDVLKHSLEFAGEDAPGHHDQEKLIDQLQKRWNDRRNPAEVRAPFVAQVYRAISGHSSYPDLRGDVIKNHAHVYGKIDPDLSAQAEAYSPEQVMTYQPSPEKGVVADRIRAAQQQIWNDTDIPRDYARGDARPSYQRPTPAPINWFRIEADAKEGKGKFTAEPEGLEADTERAEQPKQPSGPIVQADNEYDSESGQTNYKLLIPKAMLSRRIGDFPPATTPKDWSGERYILASGYAKSPAKAEEKLLYKLDFARIGVTARSHDEHEAEMKRHDAAAEPLKQAVRDYFASLETPEAATKPVSKFGAATRPSTKGVTLLQAQDMARERGIAINKRGSTDYWLKRVAEHDASAAQPPTTSSVDVFVKPMSPMQQGQAKAALSRQVRTNGEVLTRAQLVERSIAVGAKLQSYEVTDEKERAKLQAEYERTKGSHPFGNQQHPETIRFNEVKQKLADRGPKITERRLVNPDGVFRDEESIGKTAMAYAEFLLGRAPTEDSDLVLVNSTSRVKTYKDAEGRIWEARRVGAHNKFDIFMGGIEQSQGAKSQKSIVGVINLLREKLALDVEPAEPIHITTLKELEEHGPQEMNPPEPLKSSYVRTTPAPDTPERATSGQARIEFDQQTKELSEQESEFKEKAQRSKYGSKVKEQWEKKREKADQALSQVYKDYEAQRKQWRNEHLEDVIMQGDEANRLSALALLTGDSKGLYEKIKQLGIEEAERQGAKYKEAEQGSMSDAESAAISASSMIMNYPGLDRSLTKQIETELRVSNQNRRVADAKATVEALPDLTGKSQYIRQLDQTYGVPEDIERIVSEAKEADKAGRYAVEQREKSESAERDRIRDSLNPVDSINISTRGAIEESVAEGPKYAGSGHMLFVASSLKPKVVEKLRAKPAAKQYNDEMTEKVFGKALELTPDESTRATVLGVLPETSSNGTYHAFVKNSTDTMAVDGAKLLWINKNVDYDEIRAAKRGEKMVQVNFYKDGKPVGVLAGLNLRDKDLPSEPVEPVKEVVATKETDKGTALYARPDALAEDEYDLLNEQLEHQIELLKDIKDAKAENYLTPEEKALAAIVELQKARKDFDIAWKRSFERGFGRGGGFTWMNSKREFSRERLRDERDKIEHRVLNQLETLRRSGVDIPNVITPGVGMHGYSITSANLDKLLDWALTIPIDSENDKTIRAFENMKAISQTLFVRSRTEDQTSLFLEDAGKPEFTVEGDKIVLGNQAAADMVGKAMGTSSIGGMFVEHPERTVVARTLHTGLGRVAQADRELRTPAYRMAKAVNELFAAGHRSIRIAVPERMKHETAHKASYDAATERALAERHTPAGFKAITSLPEWGLIEESLNRFGYGGEELPVRMEEAYSLAIEGRYAELGLTPQGRDNFLNAWFTSFVEANGSSTEHFKELGNDINRLYTAASEAHEGQPRERSEGVRSVEDRGQVGDELGVEPPRAGEEPEFARTAGVLLRGRERPSDTSAGQATRQTDTPEFKKWFSGSVVVDANGEPERLVHSTNYDWDTFDPSQTLSSFGLHLGTPEQAAKVRETGGTKADVNAIRPLAGSQMMPVYLRLTNPLRMEDKGVWYPFEMVDALAKEGITDDKPLPSDARSVAGYKAPHHSITWQNKSEPRKKFDVAVAQKADEWVQNTPDASHDAIADQTRLIGRDYVRDLIEKAGYDGVVYDNKFEGGGDSYIAFHPEQIKSAVGNSGQFSPSNPNILMSREKPLPPSPGGLESLPVNASPDKSDLQSISMEAHPFGRGSEAQPIKKQGPGGLDVPTYAEQGDATAAETRYGEAARPEARVNRRASDAEMLSNLVVSPAFQNHGLRGFDIPTQRMVMAGMLRMSHNPEVRKVVMSPSLVDVMNVLTRVEFPTQVSLHDKSVLSDPFTVNSNGAISIRTDVADSLVVGFADAITKDALRVDSAGVAVENVSTLPASDLEHGSDRLPLKGSAREADSALFAKYDPWQHLRDLASKESFPEWPVGIKNKQTERERADLGQDPIVREMRRSIPVVFDQVEADFKPGNAEAFAARMAEKPRNLSPEETSEMSIYKAWLKNQYADAGKALSAAQDKGDEESEKTARIRLATLDEKMDIYHKMGVGTGYEWGLTGRARQVMLMADYSIAEVKTRARAANRGPLSADTEEKLAKLVEERDLAIKTLEEYDEKASIEAAKQALAHDLQLRREAERRAKRVAEKGEVRREKTVRQVVERSKLDVEFADLAARFASKLADSAFFAVNPFMVDPELLDIVKQMFENRLEAGGDTLKDTVGSIWSQLKELGGTPPDSTERDLRDALSGYGKVIQLSQEEIDVRRRKLKRLMKGVTSLEVIEQERTRPARSGMQHDKPTQEERELRKQINAAMREYGVEIEQTERSPEEMQKSALDAAKTRVRNRIEDLKTYITAGGDRGPKRIPLQPDDELQVMMDERDRLQEILDELEGPRTDEEKIALAEAAVAKSIEVWDKRIAEGDIAPHPRVVEPWSVKLGQLKIERAAQQKLVSDLRKAKAHPDKEQRAQERRLSDLNKQIAEAEAQVAAGGVKTPKPKHVPEHPVASPAIEAAKAQRDALKKIATDLRRAGKPPKPGELPEDRLWTPEELEAEAEAYAKRLGALTKALERRDAQLQEMLDTGNFTKKKRKPVQLNREMLAMKAEIKRKEDAIDQINRKLALAQRGKTEKFTFYLTGLRRAGALSSTAVLFKLSLAAYSRIFLSIGEEVAGAALPYIPGVGPVAKLAPSEGGFSLDAEIKHISTAFSKYVREQQKKMLTTGKHDIDLMFGNKRESVEPDHWFDWIGRIHAVLKTPAKLAQFERMMHKNLLWLARRGFDPTDQAIIMLAGNRAIIDANRAILQQANLISETNRRVISSLMNYKGADGKGSALAKGIAALIKFVYPVTRVPPNFVTEALNYTPLGFLMASARLAYARSAYDVGAQPQEVPASDRFKFDHGTGEWVPPGGGIPPKLPPAANAGMPSPFGEFPELADMITRGFKKSTFGSFFMLLTLLGIAGLIPLEFGGHYRRGKKKPGEVPFGGVRIAGWNLPTWTHIPLMEAMQSFADVVYLWRDHQEDSAETDEAVTKTALGFATGMASEIPFFEEPSRAFAALENEKQFTRFAADLLGGMVTPPDVSRAARTFDSATPSSPLRKIGQLTGFMRTEPVKRKPEGGTLSRFGQEIELGIPGLRKRVPADQDKYREDSKDKLTDDVRKLKASVGEAVYRKLTLGDPNTQDPDERDRARLATWNSLTPAQRDAWTKTVNDIKQAEAESKLKPDDETDIARNAQLQPFQLRFKGKGIKEALAAYEAMPPEKRAQVKEMLIDKSHLIEDLYPNEQGPAREKFKALTGEEPRTKARQRSQPKWFLLMKNAGQNPSPTP